MYLNRFSEILRAPSHIPFHSTIALLAIVSVDEGQQRLKGLKFAAGAEQLLVILMQHYVLHFL